MGGGGKFPSVLFDPAIEKWYHMKENTHVYYKLNRRTGYLGIMLTLVVPGIVLLGSTYGFGAFQPLGARRDEKYNFPESPKF
ncbi:hypothetical protein BC832DRAFT_594594 [Gaertneriomyces semiglobifer]|nr:hypothetical protein BC832DRAFT_594594 [Gaertneriomyces semiglobifer]